MGRRFPTTLTAVIPLFVLLAGGSCWGWLYDGGPEQHLGAILTNGSDVSWVAAPFTVGTDSYGTSFGGALSRSYGPLDAGFDMYLTATSTDIPNTAIAHWAIGDLTTELVYHYREPSSPVLLRAGTVYLLVFTPNSDEFSGAISYSRIGNYAYGGPDGENWAVLPLPLCVRVDGYAVPEPASAAGLAVGFLGIPVLWKKRNSRLVVRAL